MEKKIRVAMLASKLDITGIGTVILNYATKLNSREFEITVMAGSPYDVYYKTEFEKSGIKIVEVPSKSANTMAYYWTLFRCLSKNKYDVVHLHGNSATMALELVIAKLRGIKKTIAHCHSSSCSNARIHKILLPIFKRLYSKAFACSDLAGEWIFGRNNYTVLPNCFETSDFLFDPKARVAKRKLLSVTDEIILGHVGRFNSEKNQQFLLQLFCGMAEKNKDLRMLLVGTGPSFGEISAAVNELECKDQIILYGESTEISELYSAMDIFLMPSKYEGLGLVAIEAQISGLPCVVSEFIPEDVIISDCIEFLPIDDNSLELWEKSIYNLLGKKNDRSKIDDRHMMWEIKGSVVLLEEEYRELLG